MPFLRFLRALNFAEIEDRRQKTVHQNRVFVKIKKRAEVNPCPVRIANA